MLVSWPWYLLATLWVGGGLFYLRELMTLDGNNPGVTVACVLGAEILFAGFQLLLHARWRTEWKSYVPSPECGPSVPSGRSRFYYFLGLFQLFGAMIYLDIATWFWLDNTESLLTLAFAIAIAHRMLVTARKLSRIPDEAQTNLPRATEREVVPQASPEEMTKTTLVLFGCAVLFVILLCSYVAFGDYHGSPDHGPWWLGIPVVLVIVLVKLVSRKRRGPSG